LFPFQVFREDNTHVGVRCGRWSRCGYGGNHIDAPYNSDGSGTSHDPTKWESIDVSTLGDGTWYVVVYLEATTAAKHWELVPATIDYVFTQDFSSWSPANPDATYFDPDGDDSWNVYRVLATIEMNNGEVTAPRQMYRGGWIDDNAFIPDGDNPFSDDPHVRSLGTSAVDDVHEGEVGLYNITDLTDGAGVPASRPRIPFIIKDANATGDIQYLITDADMDGFDTSDYKSLHVDTGDTPDVLSMYDFFNPSAYTPGASALVPMREPGTPSYIGWCSKSDFNDWLDPIPDGSNDDDMLIWNSGAWTILSEPGASVRILSDVGSGVDWHTVSEVLSGEFWETGGDSTTCYGDDIADGSQGVVIDLNNNELQQGSAVTMINWHSGGTNLVTIGDAANAADCRMYGDLDVDLTLNVDGTAQFNSNVTVSANLTVEGSGGSPVGTVAFDRIELIGENTVNEWDTDEFKVKTNDVDIITENSGDILIDSDQDVLITAARQITIETDAGSDDPFINVGTSDITISTENQDDIIIHPGSELRIVESSTEYVGVTGSATLYNDGSTSGQATSLIFKHGICTTINEIP
jgi:hypothetical protein